MLIAAPDVSGLAKAVQAILDADKLTPADCYDANDNPNANWGAMGRAKNWARAELEKVGGADWLNVSSVGIPAPDGEFEALTLFPVDTFDPRQF